MSNTVVDVALNNSAVLWMPLIWLVMHMGYKRYFVKGGDVIADVSIRGKWSQSCALKETAIFPIICKCMYTFWQGFPT